MKLTFPVIARKTSADTNIDCIGVLNNLFADATMDYEQLTLLENQLQESATLFPSWSIAASAWTAFSFNQLNDPIQMLTLMILGFKLIYAYYMQAPQVSNEIATAPDEKSDGHHSLLVDNKADHTRLITPAASKALQRSDIHSPKLKDKKEEPSNTQTLILEK